MALRTPLPDRYESAEAEAMKAKILPVWWPLRRSPDTYLMKVGYYDKPEGHDLLGKLVATNRTLTFYGTFWGLIDSSMLARKQGYPYMIGRIWHFTWPAAGVATAFTTTAYLGAKLREKDDLLVLSILPVLCYSLNKKQFLFSNFCSWNYLAGAVAAGSVVGAWQKCHVIGWSASLVFCKYLLELFD